MQSTPAWTWPLRIFLAAMWLVHGLEKFGVRWPSFLAGGTHSVDSMLGLMADETPISPLRALIEHLMLPAAHGMQYPVAFLELSLAVLFATGFALRWAAPVGAAMQAFFWLGFLTLDWPLQYPLVVLAHLALGALAWWPKTADAWLVVLRLGAAAVWLFAGANGHPAYLLLAIFLMAGLGSRAASLIALVPLTLAFLGERFGTWPWIYYLVGAIHLAILLGARGEGLSLARYLPARLRPVLA